MTWKFLLAACLALVPSAIPAQPGSDAAPPHDGGAEAVSPGLSGSPYILAPADELRITILEAPESSADRILIDNEGYLSLPMTGRLHAAGRTVQDLEGEIRAQLIPYIHDPHVAATLLAQRPRTVSVIGAVGRPGAHTIRGPTPLVEVLSLAGGLRDDAGPQVNITRRRDQGVLPWPHVEEPGSPQTAQVEVKGILEAHHSEQHLLLPGDVVSVPRAEMVYVTGAVHRSGGFVLEERDSLSVIEALALAGGTTKVAAPKRARILRVSAEGGPRTEIAINPKGILAARAPDVHLRRDDILFIPKSGAKIALGQAADAAIRTGTGIAIFAGGRR